MAVTLAGLIESRGENIHAIAMTSCVSATTKRASEATVVDQRTDQVCQGATDSFLQ